MAVGPAPTLGGRRVSDAVKKWTCFAPEYLQTRKAPEFSLPKNTILGFVAGAWDSRDIMLKILSPFELALVLLVVGKVQCLVGGRTG